jgi:pentapeptide repeat protein
MSDAEKPKLRRANDNSWYCLATLYGEQPVKAGWRNWDSNLAAKNRMAWNRWMAAVLNDEQRADLVRKGFAKAELVPLTSVEKSTFCSAFALRTGRENELPPNPAGVVDFTHTHFDRVVIFNGFVSAGNADFSSATFGQYADFTSATFCGEANFNSATFFHYADFVFAMFFGTADYRNNNVDFRSATFSSTTDFRWAMFSGTTDFRSATFSGSAKFMAATFSRAADFRSATFSHSGDFRSATFSGEVNFGLTTFSGSADFKAATFSDFSCFSSAMFSGAAEFGAARFSRIADFGSAAFSGDAHFSTARLSQTRFKSAIFSREADFRFSTISGGAGFELARFGGYADFRSVKFSEYADFSSATFSKYANFSSATFSKVADFINAEFTANTVFADVRFGTSVPDFRGAKMHEATEWHGVNWPSAPHDKDTAQTQVYAYERLKQEMERLKKHEDEQSFFRKELRARRGLARPGSGAWLLNYIYEASSDYGQSIEKPLIWLFVLFVSGSIFFSGTPVFKGTRMTMSSAAGLSFANIFSFLPLMREITSADMVASLSRAAQIVGVVQSVLGALLLFLLGLALRTRFRMR